MASWMLGRMGQVAVALAAFIAIVALATAAAWSLAVNDLATTATELDETDLALGSAAVSRAASAQAVVFAVDHVNGTASEAAFGTALNEAAANLDAYHQLSARVERHSSPPLTIELSGFSAQGAAVLDSLAGGDVEEARRVLEGAFEAEYQVAVAALAEERAVLASRVAEARSLAGNTATSVRLAVILGLPLLLMSLGWVVHQRRLAQAREARSAEVVEANDRVRRVQEMLLAVSHRLRTPLTSIYGLSDVLVNTKRIQGLDRELVTLINAESANLHRIAEDILTATQLESGVLELDTGIVSILEVVEEAVKPVRSAGVDIKVDCPEVWVLSDGAKLRQVLRNLVSNAVDHGAEPIIVTVTESDGSVRCVVSDHGPGLSELEGGKAAESATGRGLAVAYGLAELIGATLESDRADGVTTFTLSWSDEGQEPADAEGGGNHQSDRVHAIPKPLPGERIGMGSGP